MATKRKTTGETAVPEKTGAKSAASGRFASRAAGTKVAAVGSKTTGGQRTLAASQSSKRGGAWQPQERAKFVVEVVGGTRRTADLLDVAASQPSRWVSGESVPGPAQARMLVDLEYVLTHALLVWADAAVARDWLTSPNAHLDGARPVDWIRVQGTAEVVDALRAEAAGTYA